MQRILATVNINMGLGQQNPQLLIKKSTNVSQLVQQFISIYSLPQSAYDVIIQAIQKQLTKENICLDSLGKDIKDRNQQYKNDRGRDSYGKQIRKYQKQNIPLLQIKHKKQQQKKQQQKIRKQMIPINRIQFQKKVTSPVCQQKQYKQQIPKYTKIAITRTKSPLINRNYSPYDTKRSKSPVQTRTPQRQREKQQISQFLRTTDIQKNNQFHYRTQTISHPSNYNNNNNHHTSYTNNNNNNNNINLHQTQILSQIFDTLTRNQPKSIKILSPQYVSFTGIKPQVLAILQDFFQEIQEHQFMNMDKMYFIGRIRQLNLLKKLMEAVYN